MHCLLNKNKTPSLELVKFLIDKKANVNSDLLDGYTPLHCACRYNLSLDLIETLVENKAAVNSQRKGIPLSYAVSNNNINLEILNFLIEKKSDIYDSRGKDACLNLASKNNTLLELFSNEPEKIKMHMINLFKN